MGLGKNQDGIRKSYKSIVPIFLSFVLNENRFYGLGQQNFYNLYQIFVLISSYESPTNCA